MAQESGIVTAKDAPPIDRDDVPPIILQFMARSTMKAVLKGDANAFGKTVKRQSVEDIASMMYEKVQKEKRDYLKALKKDLIYLALGKASEEWVHACFRAFRRNVKEPWLKEHGDYPGAPTREEVEEERMRQAALENRENLQQMHAEATARGSLTSRGRKAGGNRLLAALEAQMAAERAVVVKEGTEEARLQAELLKLMEAQQNAGGSRASITKQIMKMRTELRGVRRGARQEESGDDGYLSGPATGQHDVGHFIRKQKNRQMMLHARGIFDEGGMPDVKLWLELHKKKQLPTLDHANVEPNPEESVKLTDMPLERTLGQPAFAFRRPRSSFAKFYAKANPQKPQSMVANGIRPNSP